MRILFFTTAPFNPGGPGKWFYELSRELDNSGHTTYGMTWGPKSGILHLHPRLTLIPYQPFLRSNYFRFFNFMQTMIFASMILKKMVNNLSIDIVHSGGIYESFGAALGKRSCPLITTLHGDYIVELKEFLKNHPYIRIFKKYYSLMEYYALYKTKTITFPSLWLYGKLRERIKRRHIAIIPNGVTIPTQKDKYSLRNLLLIEKEKIVFLLITNFNSIFRFKAMEMLMHAFKQMRHLNKIKCVVLGGKQPTVNEPWDKLAIQEAYGLPVEFRGYQKNVYDYLFAADVLLHPSFLDNHPLSILEAMACGRPVIASNVGGIPEIIINGRGGILINNSIDLWTETLDHLIEGVYDLEYIGRENKMVVEEKFSWQIITKQYEKLYEDVKKSI